MVMPRSKFPNFNSYICLLYFLPLAYPTWCLHPYDPLASIHQPHPLFYPLSVDGHPLFPSQLTLTSWCLPSTSWIPYFYRPVASLAPQHSKSHFPLGCVSLHPFLAADFTSYPLEDEGGLLPFHFYKPPPCPSSLTTASLLRETRARYSTIFHWLPIHHAYPHQLVSSRNSTCFERCKKNSPRTSTPPLHLVDVVSQFLLPPTADNHCPCHSRHPSCPGF